MKVMGMLNRNFENAPKRYQNAFLRVTVRLRTGKDGDKHVNGSNKTIP